MHLPNKIFALLFCFSSMHAGAQQSTTDYGRTIISVSPLQVSEMTLTGVGAQVERFLSPAGKFSLYLPFAYSFGECDPCDMQAKARVFYTYPGIKFYPAGYRHTFTYAVGASLVFATGSSNDNFATNGQEVSAEYTHVYKPIVKAGALINNSLNAQATKHIYIGCDLGLGATCVNTIGGKYAGDDVLIQMNLKIGYRL